MAKTNLIWRTTSSSAGSVGCDALYLIGGKWKLRIVIALMHRKSHFNLLQRTIAGISSKVLVKELKDLELNGFVARRVYVETVIVISMS